MTASRPDHYREVRTAVAQALKAEYQRQAMSHPNEVTDWELMAQAAMTSYDRHRDRLAGDTGQDEQRQARLVTLTDVLQVLRGMDPHIGDVLVAADWVLDQHQKEHREEVRAAEQLAEQLAKRRQVEINRSES